MIPRKHKCGNDKKIENKRKEDEAKYLARSFDRIIKKSKPTGNEGSSNNIVEVIEDEVQNWMNIEKIANQDENHFVGNVNQGENFLDRNVNGDDNPEVEENASQDDEDKKTYYGPLNFCLAW